MSAEGQSDGAESGRLTIWVSGDVQGVGFRWWTRVRALELGLAGWAMNRLDGRVEVVAEGPAAALDALRALLQPNAVGDDAARRPGRVTGAVEAWTAAKGIPPGFIER